jgi:trk system potassium uptake protein TrkH
MPIASRHFTPAQLLALSIAGLIAGGTLLLRLPVSSTHAPLSLVDSLFTATSAVCVTGLIVVDTPADLSLLGQIVVLLLIQAGGLGYMAITTVVAVALGRQLSVHERLTLQEALNVETMDGLIRFTLSVFKLTLAFELTGAALLAARWWGELGPARALYVALFHSVSAFNNAGFSLFSDNLLRYRGDVIVNLVIAGLIISGGLGFVVLNELRRYVRVRRLTVHTRLVLWLSGALVLGGMALIWAIEARNPRTLGALPAFEAMLAAFFQSVSARTAGFNTIDLGAMMPASLFMVIILMFVGASPGGTGGGVKTTTFAITVAAMWGMVRGGEEPTLFRRRLQPTVVARAFFISLIAFLAVNAIALLLLLTEGRDLLATLFETTSAFGTVGFSTGQKGSVLSLAGHFSHSGKLLVAAMMFMGRVGPLTLAVAVARRSSPARLVTRKAGSWSGSREDG